MALLLPAGLLLLITTIHVALRWVAGRLRVRREACPGCGHRCTVWRSRGVLNVEGTSGRGWSGWEGSGPGTVSGWAW